MIKPKKSKWNITILEMGKPTKETIKDLTQTQAEVIKSILQRHSIRYESREV